MQINCNDLKIYIHKLPKFCPNTPKLSLNIKKNELDTLTFNLENFIFG